MKIDEIRGEVLKALHQVAPEADLAAIPPEADLRESLDLDSFSMLQVLVALHDRLGVDVPEAEAGELVSVSALVRHMAARLAEAATPPGE